MKSITYTYMREHLTEVLDELRHGVDFIVTQRGKPDLTLQGDRIAGLSKESGGTYSSVPRAGDWAAKSGEGTSARSTSLPHGTTFTSKSGGTRRDRSSSGHNEQKQPSSQPKKLSFGEAKTRTQKRHAGVIKILGDK